MSSALSMPLQRSFVLVVTLALALAGMVPLVSPPASRAVSADIVISQIYGGGGNSGATLTNDFVELFNRGTAAVDVTGWSVQYASAAGTTWQVTSLSGTIAPGRSYLVQQAAGAGGTTPLPTPDASGSIAMSATNGKVALVSGATALTGSCPTAGIVDFVGFGSADCSETAATGALSNTTAAARKAGGCTDTDSNSDDFAIGAPAPRNSATAAAPCDPGQTTSPTGVGSASPSEVLPGESTTLSVAVTPGTNPSSTQLSVTADLTAIGGDVAQALSAADGSTFAYEATVATGTAAGLKRIPVSVSDAEGRTGSTTIDLAVLSDAVGNVVVSQVYGGGGNANATFTHDFVELYNRTDAPVSLAGWSIQYGSSAGATWGVAPLAGSIQPGGHYLVQLASSNTAVGAGLPVPPDATGTLNLSGTSGKVALSSGTAPLTGACPQSAYVDLVGYGSANCAEREPAGGLSSTTAAVRLAGGAQDTNNNAADFAVASPAPRSGGGAEPLDPCVEEPTHLIHQIQGSGARTPIQFADVTVRAVVVGDYQHTGLDGYYVQEEDADADTNPATSEGVFVYDPSTVADVAVGDVVTVTGEVDEGFSQTQIEFVSAVAVCGTDATVTPADVDLPVDDRSELEAFEGMLVAFDETLTVTENFGLGQFGELVLSATGRQWQGTHAAEPGPAALAINQANQLARIILDDGDTAQNPDPLIHPAPGLTATNTVRTGATVDDLTAVMGFGFNQYRLQPVGPVTFDGAERPAEPPDVGGRIQVAAFNVLNYFNGNGDGTGFPTSRGASSLSDFVRQHDKIVAAIGALDAEVVGLMEIENDGGTAIPAVETLVDGLNEAFGEGTYASIATGPVGTDVITTAIIYQPAVVSPTGDVAVLDSSVDPRFNDDHNRPALAQSFVERATGATFTVAVNHLKSKGSGCTAAGDNQPEHLGGNCNGTRTQAAMALADWLAADPTGAGDVDSLIIGDLNSYAMETPIQALEAAGFTDLLEAFVGPDAYSYVFQGGSGYLDHGLASETITSQVTGADVWHINADEPRALEYTTEFVSESQAQLFYDPGPYRSSDHDPVIIGLDLAAFGFDGVEPPIGEHNVARAGSTVPVKFALDGQPSTEDVLFEGMQVYECGGWPSGASEDARSAGGTGLRYDPVVDQYVFAWKTDPGWAGDCMTLVVTLRDGSYATASFEFR